MTISQNNKLLWLINSTFGPKGNPTSICGFLWKAIISIVLFPIFLTSHLINLIFKSNRFEFGFFVGLLITFIGAWSAIALIVDFGLSSEIYKPGPKEWVVANTWTSYLLLIVATPIAAVVVSVFVCLCAVCLFCLIWLFTDVPKNLFNRFKNTKLFQNLKQFKDKHCSTITYK